MAPGGGDKEDQTPRRERSTSVGSKRKRSDEGDEDTKDLVEELRDVGKGLRKFLFQESSKVSKMSSEFILERVSVYEEMINKLLRQNERLRGRLEEREIMCGKMQSMFGVIMKEQLEQRERERETYVERVKQGQVKMTLDDDDVEGGGKRERERDRDRKGKTYAMIVKAREGEENKSSEQIRKEIIDEIQPECKDIRVKTVRRIKSGGVIVETVTEDELNKLKKCQGFQRKGLKVEETRKIGPKVIIYDVPGEMAEQDFMNDLYEKNLKELGMEGMKSVRVISKSGKKNAKETNYVLEVGVKARNVLLKEGRVYVGWQCLKVREFDRVPRCLNCFGFGHLGKVCKEKRICMRCGGEGHLRADCKGEEGCVNCKRRGLPHNHSVMSDECVEYKRAVERMKVRVDLH